MSYDIFGPGGSSEINAINGKLSINLGLNIIERF